MELERSSNSLPPTTSTYLQPHDEISKYAIFEQAISKYFQIIKGILPKITSLYSQTESLQQNLFNQQSKIQKLQNQQQNLHFEMRSSFLTMQSKINNITTYSSNMASENFLLKKQMEQLNREMKEVRFWKSSQIIAQNTPPQQMSPGGTQTNFEQNAQSSQKKIEGEQKKGESDKKIQGEDKKEKSKKISFQDQIIFKSNPFKLKNMISVEQQSMESAFSRLDRDQTLSNRSNNPSLKIIEEQQSNFPKRMKSQKMMKRKGTLKTNTKFSYYKTNPNAKSQKVIKSKQAIEQQTPQSLQLQKFEDILIEIQSFHKKNQIMKNNYEELMGQYCRVNQEQFNKVEKDIKQIKSKLSEMDYFHVHIQKIKINLENKIKNISTELQQKIQTKTNKAQFCNHAFQVNKRLAVLHEERKKVANKDETRKALQFLDQKLNYLCTSIQVQYNIPKLQVVDLQMSKAHVVRGRSSVLHKNKVDQKNQKMALSKTFHEQTKSNPRNTATQVDLTLQTKRQIESTHTHTRFKIEKRFNQQLAQFRKKSQHKGATEDAKTIRNHKNVQSSVNLSQLRQKTAKVLSKQKQNKSRRKLKRERMIFQYDN